MAVALGIAAACLVLLRQTEFGPGLTPDSAAYVFAASNLYAGRGFPPEFTFWPPLLPLIFAATAVFRDDMIAAAAAVNAVAFGLAVFVVATWLRRYRVSPWLVAWAGLALALSPAAGVAAYVWSESVFVLFVLAALSSMDRFLATGTPRTLLVSAGFAALCFLTRYAGASVVVCGVALIAMRTALEPKPKWKIRAALLFYATIGFAPTAVWTMRNLLVFGYPIGDRSVFDGQFQVSDTVRMLVETTLNATVGPKVLDRIDSSAPTVDGSKAHAKNQLIWLLAVWGLIGCALVRWRRAGLWPGWPGVAVAGGFVLCYVAFLAVASPLGGLNPEPRFAVPLYAPMLVVLTLALHACHAHAWSATAGWDGEWAAWRRWLVRSAMAAALWLWLAQWVAPNIVEMRQWAKHGSDGYGARRWIESETLAYLRSTTFDGCLVSNDPFAVYLLADSGNGVEFVEAAVESPAAQRQHGVGAIMSYTRGNGMPCSEDRYVVWFYAPRLRKYTNLAAFLAASPNLRLIAVHTDGIVFHQGEREAGDGADDAATQLAEALLRRGREGELAAASHFHVYYDGSRRHLTYVRRPCAPADVGPRFFLHVTPKDPADRSFVQRNTRWRPPQVGFHNLDFSFAPHGVRNGDLCVASKALPSFAIAHIRTGQWSPAQETIWSTTFAVPPAPLQ